MNTLQNLKEKGYKVNISHFRFSQRKQAMLPINYFRISNSQKDISPKGGMTIVSIKSPAGPRFTAVAECCSTDAFRRSLGIQICLTRLAKETGNPDFQ